MNFVDWIQSPCSSKFEQTRSEMENIISLQMLPIGWPVTQGSLLLFFEDVLHPWLESIFNLKLKSLEPTRIDHCYKSGHF